MVKAAENGSGCDCADALNSPMDWSILVQSPMGPYAIVVGGVLANDPPQVSFSKHDHVVDTFPSDRADQSLRYPFCHGDPSAIGLSRMPMARSRRVTIVP
jgi:hypothetical protein